MVSATPKTELQPIVFVVDDDISVRESLETLIKFAGWQLRMITCVPTLSQSFID